MRCRRSAEKNATVKNVIHSADELSVQQVERIKIAVKHCAQTNMGLGPFRHFFTSQPSIQSTESVRSTPYLRYIYKNDNSWSISI